MADNEQKSQNPNPATSAQPDVVGSKRNAQFPLPPKRKKRWPLVTGIIIAVLIVAAGIAVVVQTQNSERLQTQRSYGYTTLDGAIARIQEADASVMAIDTAVDTQITEQTPSQRKVLLDQVASTQQTLGQAIDQATSARKSFAEAGDIVLAQHVVDAATARLKMVNTGSQLVAFDIEALNATGPFSDAWEAVVNADAQMRSAAKQSAKATEAAVKTAITQNRKAQRYLKQASDDLDSAVAAFNALDVSVLTNYVQLKGDAVKLAIEADKALLADDAKTAKAKNEAFTLKDAEVVRAAEAIGADPMDLLTQAYEQATSSLRTSYTQARSIAADSDIYIRAYVGVDTMGQVQ